MKVGTQLLEQESERALRCYYASRPGSIEVPEVSLAYIEGFKEGVAQQALRAEQDWERQLGDIAGNAWERAMKAAVAVLAQELEERGVSQSIIDSIRKELEDQPWLSTL